MSPSSYSHILVFGWRYLWSSWKQLAWFIHHVLPCSRFKHTAALFPHPLLPHLCVSQLFGHLITSTSDESQHVMLCGTYFTTRGPRSYFFVSGLGRCHVLIKIQIRRIDCVIRLPAARAGSIDLARDLWSFSEKNPFVWLYEEIAWASVILSDLFCSTAEVVGRLNTLTPRHSQGTYIFN